MSHDLFFSIMPIIFFIFFALILGVILVNLVKGIALWNKNNNSPVLTVGARVVTKRTAFRRSRSVAETHNVSAYSDYFCAFEFESGDRLELSVPDIEYGMLAEGDFGRLTFQGKRFHSFERVRDYQQGNL